MNNLLESLLKSEFKFGFELEGYIGKSIIKKYSDVFDVADLDQIYNDLRKYFAQYFGSSNIDVHFDSSLNASNGGFEFPTPVMSLTPLNIQKCIKFLYSLRTDKFKIYTNKDCGFHVHFSLPNMNEQDMAWILCNISLDDNLSQLLTKFISNNKSFNFFNKFYADTDVLKKLKKYILSEKWNDVSLYLDNSKYNILRLHPQGTIEWRGPRNFLNSSNLEIIKDFFFQFIEIINGIIKIMDKKEINGISKDNFFRLVSTSKISLYKNKSLEFDDKIINSIIKNPILLSSIKYNINETSIIYLFSSIKDKLNQLNISFENFLTPLRYKHFKNRNILYKILSLNISFINYTTEEDIDDILFHLPRNKLQVIKDNISYYLNNISSDIISKLLDGKIFDNFNDLLFLIKDRTDNNLNIDAFMKPYIIKKFLKLPNSSSLNKEKNKLKQLIIKYPEISQYYEDILSVISA